MPPQRTMPPRRASARLATRQGEGDGRAGGTTGTTVPANRKSRGRTKRQQVVETASQPRLFPMLDDMVSGVVLTYLPSEELGIRWE